MPSDKELIQEWGQRTRRAQSFRQRIYTNSDWKRFEGYFRNRYPRVNPRDHWVDQGESLQVLTDGSIAREARKMVPKVTFGNPYVRVRPLAGRTVVDAKVLERVINGIFEQVSLGDTLDRGGLGTIQHGSGLFKLGYDSEYVPSYKEVLELGFSQGAFDKKSKRQEFKDYIFPGMPWVTWQHPTNVIFPEMISSFEDARWVAFQYLRPTEDLQNDKRLRNTSDLKPIPQRFADMDMSLERDSLEHEYLQDNTLCTEIRDKATGQMLIFAEGHDKLLYKEKDVLMGVLGGRLPIHALTFNNNTDYAWGTSDVHMVEEDLKELMDIRTQHSVDRRLRIPKFMYRKGSVAREQLNRLVSGNAGAGVEIEGNPSDMIRPFDMPIQADMMGEANVVTQRIREHFGTNAFGTFPSSRRSQSEVSGSQQDSQAGVSRAQLKTQELVVKLAKDIASMVFAFWTEETVVDILSPVLDSVQLPDGSSQQADVTKQVWVKFKGSELRGNFDYTLSPSRGRMVDSQQRKKEALELVQFLSQIPGVNHQELLRQIGDEFDTVDMEKVFVPMNSGQNPVGMEQLSQLAGGQQAQLKARAPKSV